MQGKAVELRQPAGQESRSEGDPLPKGSGPAVCMLSFYFHPSYSGSAIQASNLSRCLLQRGVTPTVVSANLTGSPASEMVDGLCVRRLPVFRHEALQVPSFMLGLAWYLLANRREFQIVHAHGTYQHSVASLVCRLLGRRSILKIAMGNSDIAFEHQGRLWGRVSRFFVGLFDRYIATSSEVYEECLSHGLEPSKVLQIPNGVDVGRFRPAESDEERRLIRRELRVPDVPIACFVGIVDARKNVDGLLRIWRSVIHRAIAGHLVIVGPEPESPDGRPSEYRRRLQQFIEKEGLGGHVTFAGHQSNVACYLRSSDVFLFPSRREGMPNVVLEAMASGVPCVASDIGGNADLIETGRNGYLFDVDDEEGMSAAVAQLLGNPAHARELGRAAREAVCRGLSIESTADRYVLLYKELIADPNRPLSTGAARDRTRHEQG